MRQFHWTKAHAVYVPQLDAEHRNIFRLAEELHQAVAAESGSEQVQSALRTLISCIEDHFSHEERLMQSMQYSAFDWHKKQHDTLRRQMTEFGRRIGEGETQAVTEMLESLSGWLRDHTGLSDRMMTAHLRNYERLQAAQAS